MTATEDIDLDLNRFEQRLAMQLENYAPDSHFVQDLKARLVTSKVFNRRREIGAIVVASLSLIFVATLAFYFGMLLHRAKKKISR